MKKSMAEYKFLKRHKVNTLIPKTSQWRFTFQNRFISGSIVIDLYSLRNYWSLKFRVFKFPSTERVKQNQRNLKTIQNLLTL